MSADNQNNDSPGYKLRYNQQVNDDNLVVMSESGNFTKLSSSVGQAIGSNDSLGLDD